MKLSEAFKQANSTPATFVSAGVRHYTNTGNKNLDLFTKAGSARGTDMSGAFLSAFNEDDELALRVLQWIRDVRGGAGERVQFRNMLATLEKTSPEAALKVLYKIPEIGRWDDIFVFSTRKLKEAAYTLLGDALRNGNALAAKWTPRKGKTAEEIRAFFGMTPKQYRKSLVGLTNVVETAMCAKQWDTIDFSKIPSNAARIYRKAFSRQAESSYGEYLQRLVKGEVKVNAGALQPHQITTALKGRPSANDVILMEAQWNALPDYMNGARIMPVIDVSGSMDCAVGGAPKTTCMDVAVGIGLYIATKTKSALHNTFITFDTTPKLMQFNKGTALNSVVSQTYAAPWGGSTNLEKTFTVLLDTAKQFNVPEAEMPEVIVILSDMQFNGRMYDQTAADRIKQKYAQAGYKVPTVVFWNLAGNPTTGSPVKANDVGVAMVSGFSTGILKAILGNTGNIPEAPVITPLQLMLEAVMIPRYDV